MTTQTPTDPIRDEAVRVLAEADHALCLAEWDERGRNGALAITMHGLDFHLPRAAAKLDASPTLARRLALGTALDTDPEPLSLEMDKHWLECDGPRWFCTCGEWVMGTLGVRRSDLGEHLLPFTRHGVEASLAALAAKLGSGK